MVWGCVSYNCKLDLITVRGNLNGQNYRQNILEESVVAHFDKHPLNTRPVFMDDNARSHRALVVTDYLRDESKATLPCPARSPDLNPIETVQTLNELEQTLHQEWQRRTQVQIRRLVGSMRRQIAAVIRVNGEWKLHQLLTFYACYEITKPNDSVQVQIVLK
jgi:hypothetical protein